MTRTASHADSEQSKTYTAPQAAPVATKLVDWFVLLAVLVRCVWVFSLPLRSHDPLIGFAQDDFFYYLKAAQNLAAGHGSTFDGLTRTNGYHPLYFLLWTCASFVVHSLRGAFRLLWVLDVLSALAIFLAARQILRRVTADVLLSNAFATAVLIPCIPTISFQMEVTLALPLGFAFLALGFVPAERYTPGRCFLLGLLGALTMLARLDAGILICLFLLGLLLVRGMRPVLTPRNMASFSVAALPPLLLYFALNRHYFHEWLPISGAAKQLRHGWQPDLSQMRLSFAGFSLALLAIMLAAYVAAFLLRRLLKPQEVVLCATVLLMPVLFYGVEIVVSAWKLWGWYMYALRFSLLAAAVLGLIALKRWLPARQVGRMAAAPWTGAAALLLVLLGLALTHYKVDPVMMAIADEDTRLSAFAAAHPGHYAMGDRAGMFGYLSSSAVLQAEGLMMDRAYLQHIRHEDDLLSTLRQYGVDYFVQFVFDEDRPQRLVNGCLQAQEPSIAGKDALRMRSQICGAPLAVLPSHEGSLYIYHLPLGS